MNQDDQLRFINVEGIGQMAPKRAQIQTKASDTKQSSKMSLAKTHGYKFTIPQLLVTIILAMMLPLPPVMAERQLSHNTGVLTTSTAWANSHHSSGYEPSKIIDGSYSTRYATGSNKRTGAEICIALSSCSTVTHIKIYNVYTINSAFKSVRLILKNGNPQDITVAKQQAVQQFNLNSNTITDYVKLIVNDDYNWPDSSAYLVQVFGSAASSGYCNVSPPNKILYSKQTTDVWDLRDFFTDCQVLSQWSGTSTDLILNNRWSYTKTAVTVSIQSQDSVNWGAITTSVDPQTNKLTLNYAGLGSSYKHGTIKLVYYFTDSSGVNRNSVSSAFTLRYPEDVSDYSCVSNANSHYTFNASEWSNIDMRNFIQQPSGNLFEQSYSITFTPSSVISPSSINRNNVVWSYSSTGQIETAMSFVLRSTGSNRNSPRCYFKITLCNLSVYSCQITTATVKNWATDFTKSSTATNFISPPGVCEFEDNYSLTVSPVGILTPITLNKASIQWHTLYIERVEIPVSIYLSKSGVNSPTCSFKLTLSRLNQYTCLSNSNTHLIYGVSESHYVNMASHISPPSGFSFESNYTITFSSSWELNVTAVDGAQVQWTTSSTGQVNKIMSFTLSNGAISSPSCTFKLSMCKLSQYSCQTSSSTSKAYRTAYSSSEDMRYYLSPPGSCPYLSTYTLTFSPSGSLTPTSISSYNVQWTTSATAQVNTLVSYTLSHNGTSSPTCQFKLTLSRLHDYTCRSSSSTELVYDTQGTQSVDMTNWITPPSGYNFEASYTLTFSPAILASASISGKNVQWTKSSTGQVRTLVSYTLANGVYYKTCQFRVTLCDLSLYTCRTNSNTKIVYSTSQSYSVDMTSYLNRPSQCSFESTYTISFSPAILSTTSISSKNVQWSTVSTGYIERLTSYTLSNRGNSPTCQFRITLCDLSLYSCQTSAGSTHLVYNSSSNYSVNLNSFIRPPTQCAFETSYTITFSPSTLQTNSISSNSVNWMASSTGYVSQTTSFVLRNRGTSPTCYMKVSVCDLSVYTCQSNSNTLLTYQTNENVTLDISTYIQKPSVCPYWEPSYNITFNPTGVLTYTSVSSNTVQWTTGTQGQVLNTARALTYVLRNRGTSPTCNFKVTLICPVFDYVCDTTASFAYETLTNHTIHLSDIFLLPTGRQCQYPISGYSIDFGTILTTAIDVDSYNQSEINLKIGTTTMTSSSNYLEAFGQKVFQHEQQKIIKNLEDNTIYTAPQTVEVTLTQNYTLTSRTGQDTKKCNIQLEIFPCDGDLFTCPANFIPQHTIAPSTTQTWDAHRFFVPPHKCNMTGQVGPELTFDFPNYMNQMSGKLGSWGLPVNDTFQVTSKTTNILNELTLVSLTKNSKTRTCQVNITVGTCDDCMEPQGINRDLSQYPCEQTQFPVPNYCTQAPGCPPKISYCELKEALDHEVIHTWPKPPYIMTPQAPGTKELYLQCDFLKSANFNYTVTADTRGVCSTDIKSEKVLETDDHIATISTLLSSFAPELTDTSEIIVDNYNMTQFSLPDVKVNGTTSKNYSLKFEDKPEWLVFQNVKFTVTHCIYQNVTLKFLIKDALTTLQSDIYEVPLQVKCVKLTKNESEALKESDQGKQVQEKINSSLSQVDNKTKDKVNFLEHKLKPNWFDIIDHKPTSVCVDLGQRGYKLFTFAPPKEVHVTIEGRCAKVKISPTITSGHYKFGILATKDSENIKGFTCSFEVPDLDSLRKKVKAFLKPKKSESSSDGKFKINFNDTLKKIEPKLINSSNIDIYLKPHARGRLLQATSSQKLTWYVDEIQDKSIKLKINFDYPDQISQGGEPDKLVVNISKPFLQTADGRLIQPFVTEGELSKQRSVSITNLKIMEFFKSFPLSETYLVIIQLTAILYFVGLFTGDINILFMVIRTIQTISYYHLLKVDFPMNVNLIRDEMSKVIQWDFLGQYLEWPLSKLDFDQSIIFEADKFLSGAGVNSYNILKNLSSVAAVILLFELKYLLSILAYLLVSFCCKGDSWIKLWVEKQVTVSIFRESSAMTIETLAHLVLSSITQYVYTSKVDRSLSGEILAINVGAVAALILLNCLISELYLIFVKYKVQEGEEESSLTDSRRQNTMFERMYNFLYMVNRSALIIISYLPIKLWQQFLLLQLFSLANALYVTNARVWKLHFFNRLQVLSELVIITLNSHLILFTDFVLSRDHQFMFGWQYGAFVTLYLLIGLIFIVFAYFRLICIIYVKLHLRITSYYSPVARDFNLELQRKKSAQSIKVRRKPQPVGTTDGFTSTSSDTSEDELNEAREQYRKLQQLDRKLKGNRHIELQDVYSVTSLKKMQYGKVRMEPVIQKYLFANNNEVLDKLMIYKRFIHLFEIQKADLKISYKYQISKSASQYINHTPQELFYDLNLKGVQRFLRNGIPRAFADQEINKLRQALKTLASSARYQKYNQQPRKRNENQTDLSSLNNDVTSFEFQSFDNLVNRGQNSNRKQKNIFDNDYSHLSSQSRARPAAFSSNYFDIYNN